MGDPLPAKLSGFWGFQKIGHVYWGTHSCTADTLQVLELFGLRVKLDWVELEGEEGRGRIYGCVLYYGGGGEGCHLDVLPTTPHTPLWQFLFSSWELHSPSVCLTNLKSSFSCFDCLCEKPQGKKRGREQEKKRGGERRVVAWMLVSFSPRPLWTDIFKPPA